MRGLLRTRAPGLFALLITWGFLSAACRADAPTKFDRWEKLVRALEEQDRQKPPPQNGVLFAGSSSIRLWNLAKSFPGVATINRGFGGSHIADSTHFADRLIVKHKPRLIVFYAGDNDVAAGKTPEQVAADFRNFARTVHAALPRTRIAFLSIKPSVARRGLWDRMRKANELIEATCKQDRRLSYVDVATPMLGADGMPRMELFRGDGLHLNDKGYELWTSVVRPLLAEPAGWNRFRGPNGSGVGEAVAVPARWTPEDYNWKVKLPGVGHSSPVVWGDRVFVTAGEEASGKRLVLCLNAEDGRVLWSREFAGDRHGKHGDNSYASASPAVDERHLYVCWGTPKEYVVTALTHDGADVWRADLGPFRSGHGFGPSPVVCGDVVVVADDQDGPGALFGLDRDAGKVRWKVPRRGQSSYSTPCLFQPQGRPPEVIFTNWDHGVTGIDPKTGGTSWEANVFDKGHVETAIGSPVAAGGLVLGVCGWLGVKNEVVAVRPAAKDGKPEVTYRIEKGAPLVTTPLAVGDLLFLWSDDGFVTCADVATGKVHYRERVGGAYYCSPVSDGDRIFCVARDGTVVVLAASSKFELLARNVLGEGSHSTPAVAGGRLYLRTFSRLICVGR